MPRFVEHDMSRGTMSDPEKGEGSWKDKEQTPFDEIMTLREERNKEEQKRIKWDVNATGEAGQDDEDAEGDTCPRRKPSAEGERQKLSMTSRFLQPSEQERDAARWPGSGRWTSCGCQEG